jgi:hypothetical protein
MHLRSRIIIALIGLTIIFSSCKNREESAVDFFSNVYSVENIPMQSFSIDPKVDNDLTGAKGTKIHVPKNTFVDSSGRAVTERIDLHLKEVFSKQDMVLGNLTTTYDGRPLETAGMIFIDALFKKNQLSIDKNKSIKIVSPSVSKLSNMSLFQGQKDSLGIKWVNPQLLQNPVSVKITSDEEGALELEKTTNVKYSVDGFGQKKEDYPDTVNQEVSRIAWEGEGLKISKDSVFNIGKYTVRFYKQDSLQKFSQSFKFKKGSNSFLEDNKVNYIFTLKKLGWANIDRLLNDPRTKEVELITSIENQSDFKFIYVTLITKRMYLPGYQKKDLTFCFSHDDDEKQRLPVGETATILATAYKDEKPYFVLRKIKIMDKQTVSFRLEETTKEKLRLVLEEKL